MSSYELVIALWYLIAVVVILYGLNLYALYKHSTKLTKEINDLGKSDENN